MAINIELEPHKMNAVVEVLTMNGRFLQHERKLVIIRQVKFFFFLFYSLV